MGSQATTRSLANGSSKLTIQQAAKQLAKLGYKLGPGKYDLKTNQASYTVTGPDGRTQTLNTDQIKRLIMTAPKALSMARKLSAKKRLSLASNSWTPAVAACKQANQAAVALVNAIKKLESSMPTGGAGSDVNDWLQKAKTLQSLLASGAKDIAELEQEQEDMQ